MYAWYASTWKTVVWKQPSSSQIVAMMQSTEPQRRDNLALSIADTGLSLARSFLLKAHIERRKWRSLPALFENRKLLAKN
jgi:hypothetical protein